MLPDGVKILKNYHKWQPKKLKFNTNVSVWIEVAAMIHTKISLFFTVLSLHRSAHGCFAKAGKMGLITKAIFSWGNRIGCRWWSWSFMVSTLKLNISLK